jgi:phosphoribosylcarboxyaminoimidazole (NCAIR) mutase
MNIEHTALDEKGFLEKSISIKKLENGHYLVTAYELPTGKKKEKAITMEFTQNGINALLGGMMAASGNVPVLPVSNQKFQ